MEWIETPETQAKAAGNRHSPNLKPPRRSLTLLSTYSKPLAQCPVGSLLEVGSKLVM